MTKVVFVVTGFSSFSGVDANPTERLAIWLKASLANGSLIAGQELEVRDVSVLKVAAKDVDAFFTQLAHQLEQEAAQGAGDATLTTLDRPPDDPAVPATGAHASAPPSAAARLPKQRQLVLLHLGVAATAAEYRLEARAFNCANFRVPDERGWSPVMQEIEPGRGTGSWVGSGLPLGGVCERLAARGHRVVVSEDAGQFVCNWTYYRACRLAERYGGIQVLFVHVPPLEVADEAGQRAFLLDCLRTIAGCMLTSEERAAEVELVAA